VPGNSELMGSSESIILYIVGIALVVSVYKGEGVKISIIKVEPLIFFQVVLVYKGG
jgi:hypothetical protein